VAVDLRVDYSGIVTLHAFSFGRPYTLDPSRLRFFARPMNAPANAPRSPLRAVIGAPLFTPAQGGGGLEQLREYVMSVTFTRPSPNGGLYRVRLEAAKGFAYSGARIPLPFGDWSTSPRPWEMVMWWPTHRDEASLSALRKRFEGHDVFAYSGASLRCGPAVQSFRAGVPLHVRSVERERDRVAMFWPGAHGGSDLAPRFLAFGPLRFVFDQPRARPIGWGGSVEGNGCPAIELADWQRDVTFSLHAPPASLEPVGTRFPAIRKGMTREEVAWIVGYPTDFARRAAIDAEPVWFYVAGAYGSFSVTFRDGRVTSFTTPSSSP
jgi:hypothetical protein